VSIDPAVRLGIREAVLPYVSTLSLVLRDDSVKATLSISTSLAIQVEAFIERHSPRNRELKEIPRAQVRAVRPKLEKILKGRDDRGIVRRTRKSADHEKKPWCV